MTEIRIGDCWTDEEGNHWFCKNVHAQTVSAGVSYSAVKMVRYEENGFFLIHVVDFLECHPGAKLYLREGKHER